MPEKRENTLLSGGRIIPLPYTICFCLHGDQVLMLYRINPPNARCWNGLGGKIEAGETPLQNIQRETMEEAEIDLYQARELRFAGLVTWTILDDHMRSSCGMYVFIARMAPNYSVWADRSTSEGLLSWKALNWVCDPDNLSVVSNIPHFLPDMLTNLKPQEYHCSYREGILQTIMTHALPDYVRDN